MQFAYQAGKSTVSALRHLVRRIEKALRYKENTVRDAAERRNIEQETVEWTMLECRIRICQIKVRNGASNNNDHQRLPLVIYKLLTDLYSQGYEVF
jgi:hypothetical protein